LVIDVSEHHILMLRHRHIVGKRSTADQHGKARKKKPHGGETLVG
jgi:hypothetical protein